MFRGGLYGPYVAARRSTRFPTLHHLRHAFTRTSAPPATTIRTTLRSYLPPLSPRLRHPITLTLFLFLYGHLVFNYILTLGACSGISMLPTIASDGDWVLVSKHYRRGRDIRVGDVISFKHPIHEEDEAVKRVLGMPGDFVLRDTPSTGEGKMVQVPPGHCWVVGDNLPHSRDSRIFGPLPLALVRGKVIYRLTGKFLTDWRRMDGFLEDEVD